MLNGILYSAVAKEFLSLVENARIDVTQSTSLTLDWLATSNAAFYGALNSAPKDFTLIEKGVYYRGNTTNLDVSSYDIVKVTELSGTAVPVYLTYDNPAEIWDMLKPLPKVGGLGNSILANGGNPDVALGGTHAAAQDLVNNRIGTLASDNLLLRTCMRLPAVYGGLAAVGGYTSTQIKDTCLPLAVRAKWGFALCVLTTNDITTGMTVSQSRENVVEMIESLLEVGTIPVLLGEPGATNVLYDAYMPWNLMMRRLAEDYRLMYVPIGEATVGTNGYGTASKFKDSSHLNGLGCSDASSMVASAMMNQYHFPTPLRAFYNSGATTFNLVSNPLMADGSGVPTGWTKASGDATAANSNNATFGKWFDVTTSGTTVDYVTGNLVSDTTSRRRILSVLRLKSSNLKANSGNFRLRLHNSNYETRDLDWELSNWTDDVVDGYLILDSTSSEASAAATKTGRRIQFNHAASTGAVVSLAEAQVINLTALGYPLSDVV